MRFGWVGPYSPGWLDLAWSAGHRAALPNPQISRQAETGPTFNYGARIGLEPGVDALHQRSGGWLRWRGQRTAYFFGGRADASCFLPALNFGTCGCFGLRTSGSAGSWICFLSLPGGRLLMVDSIGG